VDYCVALLCTVLSVTRSAYYAWAKAAQVPKAKQDALLKSVITSVFTKNRAVYGTRRLKKVLAKQGYTASRRHHLPCHRRRLVILGGIVFMVHAFGF